LPACRRGRYYSRDPAIRHVSALQVAASRWPYCGGDLVDEGLHDFVFRHSSA
jgi:hypothetical protein